MDKICKEALYMRKYRVLLLALTMFSLLAWGCNSSTDSGKVPGSVDGKEEVVEESSLNLEMVETTKGDMAEAETTESVEEVSQVRKLELRIPKVSAVGWKIDFTNAVERIIYTTTEVKRIQFAFCDEDLNENGEFYLQEDMVTDGKAIIPLKVISGSKDQWYIEIDVFDEASAPQWYQWVISECGKEYRENIDGVLIKYMDTTCTLGTEKFWVALEDALSEVCGVKEYPSWIYEGMMIDQQMGLFTEDAWSTDEEWQQARRATYAGLSQIPMYILERFQEDDGTIHWVTGRVTAINGGKSGLAEYVVDAEGSSNGGASGDAAMERYIRITDLYGAEQFYGKALIHEMGHYVNDISNMLSETDEWHGYCEAVKAKLNGEYGILMENTGDLKVHNLWVTTDAGRMYREYSFYNDQEFFADSFTLYVLFGELFQKNYPDVYAAMDACVKSLQ